MIVWLSLWRGLQTSPGERIPFAEIVAMVARKHDLTVKDLLGRSSARDIAWARQEAMWMARRHTGLSLPALGSRFGRDHSTVLYGVRQHEARMKMEEAA